LSDDAGALASDDAGALASDDAGALAGKKPRLESSEGLECHRVLVLAVLHRRALGKPVARPAEGRAVGEAHAERECDAAQSSQRTSCSEKMMNLALLNLH